MTKSADTAITPETVDELRDLAKWANSSIRGSDQLIGEKKFRRRWSKFGAENALRAVDLWSEAKREAQQAQAARTEAEAELQRIRRLIAARPQARTDDPAAFPALYGEVVDAQARFSAVSQQLEQAREQETTALADGKERLLRLTAQVASRRQELANLEEIIETEGQDLAKLRSDVEARGEVRDRLQRLVTAINDQLGG